MMDADGAVADVGTAEAAPAEAEAPAVEETPSEETPTEVAETPDAEVPAGAVIETPQWSDEQWSAWDGSKDSLDEQYHSIFDRLSDTLTASHAEEAARLNSIIDQRDASIRALMIGEDDPQLDVLNGQVAERDETITKLNARLAEAQKALESIRDEYTAERDRETAVEVKRFEERHGWLYESDNQQLRDAVSSLIDQGLMPSIAADYVKDKPAAFQQTFSELVLAGTSPEVASAMAQRITAKAAPEPLPAPKPGAEFVNGSGATKTRSHTKKTAFNSGSVRDVRNAMVDSLVVNG